jgi:hypothetical protein
MKLLFLHIVKTGGTTANNAFSRVLRRRRYFMHVMDGEKANDFSEAQLEQIATAPGFDQYCHCHIGAMSEDLHDLFRANGWFSVCFIRNPADLLCSLFHYTKKLRPDDARTIDEFIDERISAPESEDAFWQLPPWHEKISCVRVFTAARLRSFLNVYLNEENAKVRTLNPSGSLGFGHHCSTGEIKTSTMRKLFKHKQTKLYCAQVAREKS